MHSIIFVRPERFANEAGWIGLVRLPHPNSAHSFGLLNTHGRTNMFAFFHFFNIIGKIVRICLNFFNIIGKIVSIAGHRSEDSKSTIPQKTLLCDVSDDIIASLYEPYDRTCMYIGVYTKRHEMYLHGAPTRAF